MKKSPPSSGMIVLIIGRGSRAYALLLQYMQDDRVRTIVVAPGNGFMAWRRTKRVVVEPACDLTSTACILSLVDKYNPDLIDLADDYAVAGDAADILRQEGRMVFAPGMGAARLESDKAWARDFMYRHSIAIPEYRVFTSADAARSYIDQLYDQIYGPDHVCFVKAAGLAAGKGSLRAGSKEEAYARVDQMQRFGDAGMKFVIEQGLAGDEYSLFAISDGKTHYTFRPARDYKRALPYDEGEQTGSMGAETMLVDEATLGLMERETIAKPLRAMARDGTPYRGILYTGGMLVAGKPHVLEFNARWGDPDGSLALHGITAPYAQMVMAACTGDLARFLAEHPRIEDTKCRVAVVGAARGYPGDCSLVRGKRIWGVEEACRVAHTTFLGAGIAVEGNAFYADGSGRIFCIVGEGNNIPEARSRAWEAFSYIYVEDDMLQMRHDIGWRGMREFYAHAGDQRYALSR